MIVRRNLTNFQPSSPPATRDTHPRSRSLECAFKSSKILSHPPFHPPVRTGTSIFSRALPPLLPGRYSAPSVHRAHPRPRAISPPTTASRKAWSTSTTAQGPILPTHNLQFHILFPSRVRQRRRKGFHRDKLVSLSPSIANHLSSARSTGSPRAVFLRGKGNA